MTNLTEVLEDQIKDLFNAESQLAKSMPRMAKKASTPELKQAFLTHIEETKLQIERLKQVAEELGIKPTGKVCKAMQGLVAEGAEVLEESDGMSGPVVDAALIAAAQRIEHYEIAAYGTVCVLAEVLGNPRVKKLLGQTLNEEERTDKLLTDCAEQYIYPNAPKTQADEQGETDESEDDMPAAKSSKKTAKTTTQRR